MAGLCNLALGWSSLAGISFPFGPALNTHFYTHIYWQYSPHIKNKYNEIINEPYSTDLHKAFSTQSLLLGKHCSHISSCFSLPSLLRRSSRLAEQRRACFSTFLLDRVWKTSLLLVFLCSPQRRPLVRVCLHQQWTASLPSPVFERNCNAREKQEMPVSVGSRNYWMSSSVGDIAGKS